MKKILLSNLYTNLPCSYTVCLSSHIDSEFHSKYCALCKGIHDYSFVSASWCTNFYINSLLVELPNRKHSITGRESKQMQVKCKLFLLTEVSMMAAISRSGAGFEERALRVVHAHVMRLFL